MSTPGFDYFGRRETLPRRKKKKNTAKTPPQRLAPGPLGHNPFADLKGLDLGGKPEESRPGPAIAAAPAPAPEPDEADMFQAAMAEVTPLDRPFERISGPVEEPKRTPLEPAINEDLEVLTHLEELVAGRVQFDLVDTDEYLEGYIKGLNPLILKKLRLGLFSVQSYLDLHGMTVLEAEEAVRKFIIKSVALGRRCVLLVHGRGLNSKDHIPVLKKKLDAILLTGPTRKHILAFTSARPHDGGAGASYVLLRAKN